NCTLSAAKAAASLTSAGASGPWMTPRGPPTGACRINQRCLSALIFELGQQCCEQQQDRGLAELLGAAEHIAGLAADLALRQPRHAGRAASRRQRRAKRRAPG